MTIFYTAPTAIRAFMRAGRELVDKHDLSSLRLLGTVGEPINPEAWMWYHEVIGHEHCPIVDTWWQTETGGIMITPLPGATPTKPGTATLPFFGVDAAIVDRDGKELGPNQGGLLVIRKPWPTHAARHLQRPRALREAVLERRPRHATSPATAPGATTTAISGSWAASTTCSTSPATASARRKSKARWSRHEAVAEAAVVGMPHEMKGQGIAAFVTLRSRPQADRRAEEGTDRSRCAKQIGALAQPDQIRFTEALPKTRSGKIMRRLLKELASGGEVKGDTTTLEDFSVLAKLKEKDEG